MVTVVVVGDAGRPFAAEPDRTTAAPEPRVRIGWALVVAALAEVIVAATAIAAGSFVIGLAAVVFIGLAGLILCAAETTNVGRGTDR